MNKGKIYSIIAAVLYFIFWILLLVFGIFSNPVSRYVLHLFDDGGETYLLFLGLILLTIMIVGTILSEKAKKITEGSRFSKIIAAAYWIAIVLVILAICAFIFFFIMMVITGSYM